MKKEKENQKPVLAYPPCACPDCNEWIAEDDPFQRIGFHGKPYCLRCGTFLLNQEKGRKMGYN